MVIEKKYYDIAQRELEEMQREINEEKAQMSEEEILEDVKAKGRDEPERACRLMRSRCDYDVKNA